MINLLIFGNGTPAMNVIDSLNKNDIKVVDIEQDKLLIPEEQHVFASYLDARGIYLNKLDKLTRKDYDLILVVNYNKIIDIEQFKDAMILNLHLGILPKYRGNNANVWAVINGESEVGYTIHEVTDILDGGDIYYRYAFNIRLSGTYLTAKNCMNLDIKNNLNRILLSIVNNKITPVSQEGFPFVYCTKIKPSDGIIDNWNVSSDFLTRKNYVFQKPYGTGMSFAYKDEYYEFDNIFPIEKFEISVGIPGSIVYIKGNALWVKTSDTAVELSGIRYQSSIIDVNKIFKIGMRLQNSKPALNKDKPEKNDKPIAENINFKESETSKYEKEYIELPFENILREYRKKNITEILKKYSYKSFLEIGCGPDPLAKDITNFDKIVVVEPGKLFYHMVKMQTNGDPKITVINDLVENVVNKLKKKTFNFIVIGGFLHEIDNPEIVLEAVRKICSKHTIVYSFVPNAKSFHRLLAFKMGIIKDIYEKSSHDKMFCRQKVFDIETFNTLFTKNGFNVIDSGSYFMKPFTHNQMSDLLDYRFIDKSFLDGFDKMIDFLPDMGAEIWNISRING